MMLFFRKLADKGQKLYYKRTPQQMFPIDFYEFFQNIPSIEQLWTGADTAFFKEVSQNFSKVGFC